MLALASRALCVGTFATVGIIACAPATSSSVRESRYASSVYPLTATSRVIDSDRIERSGSTTALDAIRALVPGYSGIDTRPLGSAWLGGGSGARAGLRVLIDGHPIADVESLRMIRARDLLAIHVLSAPDATIRFGSDYGGGAIVLQTRNALRLRD